VLERLHWMHVLIGLAVLVVVAFAASPAADDIRTQLNPSTGELGVITVEGAISYGGGVQDGGVSPRTLDKLTKQATSDGADALLYEIDSGGGAVVASKEAARVIADAGVPTVCRLREIAASGAYWAASACDTVVADPLTLTGSIGVSSTYLEFSGLLDRFGVEYVNLTAGKYKDMGSQYKNLTPAERERFNDILNQTHAAFIRAVAENRNMSYNAVEAAATGEVFLGREAKRLGLVDRLGGRKTAIAAAHNLTNTSELETTRYEPPQQLEALSFLFSKVGEGIAQGISSQQESGISAR
ncbi:MAG: signal peptide peptidase SppA, partial [Candidatus Nanohaloarchaea archaeon]